MNQLKTNQRGLRDFMTRVEQFFAQSFLKYNTKLILTVYFKRKMGTKNGTESGKISFYKTKIKI